MSCFTKKRITFLLLVVLVIVTSTPVWSMPGTAHTTVWELVTGLTGMSADGDNNLESLWLKTQKLIDGYVEDNGTNVYQELIKECADDNGNKWFDWGNYGHRILFHWGFNNSPRIHEPLRVQVLRCLTLVYGLDSGTANPLEEKLFLYAEKLHKARRDELIRKAEDVTGFDRDDAVALATIVYSVHVLCDYADTRIDPLPPINLIQKDIIERGFKVLLENVSLPSGTLYQIDSEIDSGYNLDTRERARHIIQVTGKYLPRILGEKYYRDVLETRQISINPLPSDMESALTAFLGQEFMLQNREYHD